VFVQFKGERDAGDLRCDNKHYVVVPTGYYHNRYWLEEPAGLEDFPVLTLDQTGFHPPPSSSPSPTTVAPPASSKCVTPGRSPDRDAEVVPDTVEGIIRCCLPEGPGERNACLGKLARYLRRLPGLGDADEDVVEPYVRAWHGQAVDSVRDKAWETSWGEFCRWWRTCKPTVAGGWEAAVARALERDCPPEASHYLSPAVRKLATLCAGLQRDLGELSFFLSCREAQKWCGFGTWRTALRWLGRFVDAGLLELVKKGEPGVRGKASEYRWRPLLASPRRDEPSVDVGAGLAA
jgi:hypothetical protein